MSGIFRQVADTLVDLTRAARTGADPDGIRVAHMALRDQWEAAAEDARKGGAGSVDRFETVAAATPAKASASSAETSRGSNSSNRFGQSTPRRSRWE